MKTLNKSLLDAYEIKRNAPATVRILQFGDDDMMLGVVDRLIDTANENGLNMGIKLIGTSAETLREQDFMYTIVIRGEKNGDKLYREQVAQVFSAEGDTNIGLILLSDAARENTDALLLFLKESQINLPIIIVGTDADCAERLKAELTAIGNLSPAYPSFADSLTRRSDAKEAARICGEMNYKDSMLYLAEPYALWAIQADDNLKRAFPLCDYAKQIIFTDDIAPLLRKKERVFDAGLFAIAALGCLRGNETLADCMKDEPLRDTVGHIFMDEILPKLPFSREEIAPYIIECFERYENNAAGNAIPDCATELIRKFTRGVLPTIRDRAENDFVCPKGLCMAFAAMLLVYSSVRRGEDGIYTVQINDRVVALPEPPEYLQAFSCLAPDMSPDALAYAALADRTLWGQDLREIDGFEDAIAAALEEQLTEEK